MSRKQLENEIEYLYCILLRRQQNNATMSIVCGMRDETRKVDDWETHIKMSYVVVNCYSIINANEKEFLVIQLRIIIAT